MKLYAVITGDVVDYTKLSPSHQQKLLNVLKASFEVVRKRTGQSGVVSFDMFRGDSFQGIIPKPGDALRDVLTMRGMIRSAEPSDSDVTWDVRTAVGIGPIETIPGRVTEGDGEAFRRSGPALDELRGRERFSIRSPWPEMDGELEVSSALLDAVIARWTPKQAEVVIELLQQKSQEQIARELGISQTAVSYRVRDAGWFAVKRLLKRYEKLILQYTGISD